MRRCRLDIGGKIQAGIIDNLKPSLYQIPRNIFTNTLWTASYCKLRIDCRVFEVTEVFSTIYLTDLATRWEHNARGLRQTISRELDGHLTISGIFGIEQFPVVD